MTTQPIVIAVDAMGGDHAPHEIVKGAIQETSVPVAVELVNLTLFRQNSISTIHQALTFALLKP